MVNPIINDNDLKIIAELARDGRATGRQIAPSLTIKEGATRLRLQQLLSSVVSVKALVNPSIVGLPVEAFLAFKVEPPSVSDVVDKLASHERVRYVSSVTGIFDVIALAMFRSAKDLMGFMEEFVGHIEGLKDVQTSIFLETQLGRFTNLDPEVLRDADGIPSGLNSLDIRMLSLLMEDGRLSTRELARRLKVSEVSARKRLRRLLKERIITIRGMVHPEDIGFPVVATIGLSVDLRRLQSIAIALRDHEQMVFVGVFTGIFDIIATGLFRSNKELYKTIRDFIYKIEGVKETQTFINMEDEHSRIPLFVPRITSGY
ncbi:Lrp/AsnC family transcriptional regulator [Chloroflexota bacterium]